MREIKRLHTAREQKAIALAHRHKIDSSMMLGQGHFANEGNLFH